MSITRRHVLQLAAAGSLYSILPAHAAEDTTLPTTGKAVEGLANFDGWVRDFMQKHEVPGGQLAIAKGGELIYSRGFGYADVEAKELVEPTSLMRIASVSKPITGVAIMQLVEQGKLKVDDTIDSLLKIEPFLAADDKVDERWPQITIAHCLTHVGGWDRGKSFDPMFYQFAMAKALDVKLPIGHAQMLRFMRGKPLDFDPGERVAYSNFGFCLLGRVIEKLTGKTYEEYVLEEVFAPLKLTAPRIGKSLEDQRAPGEVKYYLSRDLKEMPITGPHAGDKKFEVPVCYGAWDQEILDSHGGWICSAQDLVTFASALDQAGPLANRLLKSETRQAMFQPRAVLKPGNAQGTGRVAMGYGWFVGTEDGNDAKPVRAHGGALACTAASLVKLHDDINIAVLFNQGQSKAGKFISGGLDAELVALARAAKWE